MADFENIFIAVATGRHDLARSLIRLFSYEYIDGEPVPETERIGLRGQSLTRDGFTGLAVGENSSYESDDELDEISAADAYPFEVEVWIPGRDPEEQRREARAIFERLSAAMPDTSLLLVHEVTWLYASRLPGQPIHDFPPRTSIYDDCADVWLPWVLRTDKMPDTKSTHG